MDTDSSENLQLFVPPLLKWKEMCNLLKEWWNTAIIMSVFQRLLSVLLVTSFWFVYIFLLQPRCPPKTLIIIFLDLKDFLLNLSTWSSSTSVWPIKKWTCFINEAIIHSVCSVFSASRLHLAISVRNFFIPWAYQLRITSASHLLFHLHKLSQS